MQATTTPVRGKPAICNILEYLLDSRGLALDCPPRSDPVRLAQYLAGKTQISARTIRSIVDGSYGRKLRQVTADRLADFFGREGAPINPQWLFAPTLDEYLEKEVKAVSSESGEDGVALRIPRYRDSCKRLAEWLSGIYVCYRYPFEAYSGDEVVREVLQIFYYKGELRFTVSFWPRDTPRDHDAFTFNGVIIPLGRSLFFVGVNIGQASADRGRSLFIDDDKSSLDLKNCKIGLMSSTRLHGNMAPCTACTILIRTQWEPDDVEEYIEEVTKIDSFDKIIKDDFGGNKATLNYLRSFLDNRPIGSQKEPELMELEGELPQQPVLRVNPERFNTQMPRILRSVMDNEAILAPFKPNWSRRQK